MTLNFILCTFLVNCISNTMQKLNLGFSGISIVCNVEMIKIMHQLKLFTTSPAAIAISLKRPMPGRLAASPPLRRVIKDVAYNKDRDNFTVLAKDLKKDKVLGGEDFNYVIVATGHYSVPNVPTFLGIER